MTMLHKRSVVSSGFALMLLIVLMDVSIASSVKGLSKEAVPGLEPMAVHADQRRYIELIKQGNDDEAFTLAFEEGDELFETRFNAADGVGANVGNGQRFTRVPRADLDGEGEWASHVPPRSTGPNAQACNSCHNQPMDDGAGLAADNVHRDPHHMGTPTGFITRNAPHLFGIGAVQRLAEEMTEELHELRRVAVDQSCSVDGTEAQVSLSAKGIPFGQLSVRVIQRDPCHYEIDTTEISGVNSDLVVRPFHWKGRDASLRKFNRDASHNELGMQPVEMVGEGVDGDGDGVVNEMTVGDQTALVIYLAAQPRPTTLLELESLGLVASLDQAHRQSIEEGEALFAQVGCAGCHSPSLELGDPIYREPSSNAHFRDASFAGNTHPESFGVDPLHPVSFDLTRDLPDNHLKSSVGGVEQFGSFETASSGEAIVRLYSDLKRHDMGDQLAEGIDETGVGESVWLTRSLWGVGSTAPYLHDGRATSLAEAIAAHGGAAGDSRNAYQAISAPEQQAIIAFLENMVLFKIEEEEDVMTLNVAEEGHQ